MISGAKLGILQETRTKSVPQKAYLQLRNKELFVDNIMFTVSLLLETQQCGGKPCSMGTKNWRHPVQCPTNSIMQIRLKVLI